MSSNLKITVARGRRSVLNTSARLVAATVLFLFHPANTSFCWIFCSAFSVGHVRFISKLWLHKGHERLALVEHIV
jgi:hypothetical protein